jgi:hypothetical protein
MTMSEGKYLIIFQVEDMEKNLVLMSTVGKA